VPSAPDLGALDAQVAFLGVPYDAGTPEPNIPTGQRAGPAAAREATSAQFYYPRSARPGNDPGAEGWYDVELDRDYLVGVTMADVGDVAIQGSDTEGNYRRITDAARAIAERRAQSAERRAQSDDGGDRRRSLDQLSARPRHGAIR
jgi:arginase family enzyme